MYSISRLNRKEFLTVRVVQRSELAGHSGQILLQEVLEKGYKVHCLCCGSHEAPLVVLTNTAGLLGLYVVHPKGKGPKHSHGCAHAYDEKIAEAFGVSPDSITSRSGIVCVDFDFLLRSPEPSGTGVPWQSGHHDLSQSLRSLLWLLLVRSSLNVAVPRRSSVNPWAEMLYSAQEITVRGAAHLSRLAHLLVLPTITDPDTATGNQARLWDAEKGCARVLTACLLPRSSEGGASLNAVNFDGIFDVTVELPHDVLTQALEKTPFARDWHAANGHVLAFGVANAEVYRPPNGDSPRRIARLSQLVLMPVSEALTPLPTPRHSKAFSQKMAAKQLFMVQPKEDPLIAMPSDTVIYKVPKQKVLPKAPRHQKSLDLFEYAQRQMGMTADGGQQAGRPLFSRPKALSASDLKKAPNLSAVAESGNPMLDPDSRRSSK